MSMIADFHAEVRLVDASSRLNIRGGSTYIRTGPRAPAKNFYFFRLSDGLIFLESHDSYILEAIRGFGTRSTRDITDSNPYVQLQPNEVRNDTPSVFYTWVGGSGGGNIRVNDCTLDMESVFPLNRVLAHTDNPGSFIALLNIKTLFTFVPHVTGIVENIKYVALSNDGNLVTSGGFYTNIVTVDQELVGEFYFIQDSDRTILVRDPAPKILLPDPTIVSDEVIYKGKEIYITNITNGNSVTIEGPIVREETRILPPNTTMHLQVGNDIWYVLGIYPTI